MRDNLREFQKMAGYQTRVSRGNHRVIRYLKEGRLCNIKCCPLVFKEDVLCG